MLRLVLVNSSRFFRQIVERTGTFSSLEFIGIRSAHLTATMPKRKHSIEKDEMLIAEVKKHPFLYDRNHKGFNNHDMRKERWEEIGAIVQISDLDAKLRWINIRDCFARCLKKAKRKADAEGAKSYRYHYKYASQLKFLVPYLPVVGDDILAPEDPDQYNEGDDDDGDEDYRPTRVPPPDPVPRPTLTRVKKQKTQERKDEPEPNIDYLVTHENPPREDSLDTFFKSICATVRTLPPIAQAQLRFQITELVFKAEMSHLTNSKDMFPDELCHGVEIVSHNEDSASISNHEAGHQSGSEPPYQC